MLKSVDFSGRPFHFIGIGGIGMSALAHILTERKLPVSGSDTRASHITQRLQDLGAHIFWTQDPANFEYFSRPRDRGPRPAAIGPGRNGSDPTATPHPVGRRAALLDAPAADLPATTPDLPLPQVICSTAIREENPEYRAALALGCPIFHRADLLAALMEVYRGVAVAGTHGKTTTSSAIGFLLMEAGLDPTIIVGGEVAAWGGNARLGRSDYLVAEADESDGSLVKLCPEVGVITNIELDHPDHYTSLEEVVATFQTFADRCKFTIGCIDCPTARDRLSFDLTYSLDPRSGADYVADNAVYRPDGISARVLERGRELGRLFLPLLGRHNLSNALAAIAVGRHLGLDFATIAEILGRFEGARRRFELRGTANDIALYDDYAHHPSEIRATLAAARQRVGPAGEPGVGRLVAVFQPHRFSRTLAFLDEFAQAFQDADLVAIADIYSAGEPDSGEIDGRQVADWVARYHPQVTYQPALEDVRAHLRRTLRPGDAVFFLGAGNLNQVVPDVLADCDGLPESA